MRHLRQSGAPTAPPISSRSVFMRSSIAARKPPESPPSTASISTRTAAMGHVARNFDRDEVDSLARRPNRHRSRALFDNRRIGPAQYPAAVRRARRRWLRGRSQRQFVERAEAPADAQPPRLDLPVDRRHRGHHPSRRHLRLFHHARPPDRCIEAGRRRLFAARADRGGPDRLPRPAWNPAAGHGQARRGDDLRVGKRRARRDRRDLPARRRAGRAGPRQRQRHPLVQPVRESGAAAVRVRARLFLAPQFGRRRPVGLSGQEGDRRRACARGAGRGRLRRSGSR